MKKKYLKFNFVCAFFISFFIFGIFLVWNTETKVEVDQNISKVEVFKRTELIKITEKNISQDEEKNKIENVSSTEENLIMDLEVAIKELPKEINLAVPFTSQAPEFNWSMPWQDACEEATVLMLDAYYKEYGLSPIFSRDEMQKMINWQTELSWSSSIPVEKILKLAENFTLKKYRIINNPTITQIKEFIAQGDPVIVVAYGKDLPNPYFTEGGPDYHALVIRGYTEDSFITNDPGTKRGENFTYKYSDLMQAIHDWNDGDVKNGMKVVLVAD